MGLEGGLRFQAPLKRLRRTAASARRRAVKVLHAATTSFPAWLSGLAWRPRRTSTLMGNLTPRTSRPTRIGICGMMRGLMLSTVSTARTYHNVVAGWRASPASSLRRPTGPTSSVSVELAFACLAGLPSSVACRPQTCCATNVCRNAVKRLRAANPGQLPGQLLRWGDGSILRLHVSAEAQKR